MLNLRKIDGGQSNRMLVIAVFLLVVFALGGSSRADTLSLFLLRPFSAIVLAVGLFALVPDHYRQHHFLLNFAVVAAVVSLLHLIPLPPAVWGLFPGRGLIAEIDAAAGLGAVWRPLTLVPQDGWNVLFAGLVPGAALVLAVGLETKDHAKLAMLFALIAAVSVLIGILQLQGGSADALYFYRITNEGTLVGLFANRNHHAMFLATILPILAFLVSRPAKTRGRRQIQLGLAFFGSLFIVAALVVNGSRAGFLIGLAAAILSVFLVRDTEVLARTHRDGAPKFAFITQRWKAIAFTAIAAIAIAFLYFSNSETMDRVIQTDAGDELRFKIWGPIFDMGWKYFPVGSGVGSFVETYKIDEPLELLGFRYVNHAHNDWLEVFLTMGMPGLLLMAAAVAAWAVASKAVFGKAAGNGQDMQLARLGSGIVALLALGSFIDYPLRTPALACYFVIAAVWLSRGYAGLEKDLGNSG